MKIDYFKLAWQVLIEGHVECKSIYDFTTSFWSEQVVPLGISCFNEWFSLAAVIRVIHT